MCAWRMKCWVAAAVASVAGAGPAPAENFPLIGNSFRPFVFLFDVDQTTGHARNHRTIGVELLTGITSDLDGTIYGLTALSGNEPNSLISIDPVTGRHAVVGRTGLNRIFEGDLDFDPTTGLLYGVQDEPLDRFHKDLFQIDKQTGVATVIGTIPRPDGGDLSALAFDSAGNLYVLDTRQEELLRIDKTNAAILDAVGTSVPLGIAAGMTFDGATGRFLVADGDEEATNSLYQLDALTGSMTLVGSLRIPGGLAGLTFVVPEPGTLLLLGGGLPLLLRRRGR